MKKLLILAGTFAALTFTACKKDDDTQSGSGNSNGNGSTPSKLLKKLTKKIGDISTIYNLSYDASKRLTSIISTDNKESIVFTYDASGNVTKLEQNEEDFHNIYTYSYTNNVPVSGHFKSWEKHSNAADELIEDDNLSYTVANGNVTRIHLDMTLGGSQVDFDLTYTDGNVSQIKTPNNLYTATFTYGTKKPIFPKVFKYVMDQAGFAMQFFAKNEIKTTNFDFPGTNFDSSSSVTYTYDADGYVITSAEGTTHTQFEYQ
jgi:hypothetical protein